MQQAFAQLGRTLCIHAAMVCFSGGAQNFPAAFRTMAGELEGARSARVIFVRHDFDDLGDHIPATLDQYPVADLDSEPIDLVLIVQGGAFHRSPPDRDRPQRRKRREFAGAPYEHVFFVADTEMTGTMVPDEVNVYLFRDGFHLLFPMRGKNHWRIAGILPMELRNKPDLKFDAVIPSLRGEAGDALSIKSCSWFSTYRIHHRRAVRFRDRRCFLLGDAAHIHSPVGAQGMNTGLQDAYNLAWKLALVVKNQAKPALLDSYEQERIPVAKALLNGTDRAFRLVVSDTWIAGLLRTKILARFAAFAVNRKAVQRMAFRTVSQTGIRYPKSSLSKSLSPLPDSTPQAGDRFPWLRLKLAADGPIEDLFQKFDDTHFHLISTGQTASPEDITEFGELLRTHVVPSNADNDAELARAGIPRSSFYLIRPDGYVGLCGARWDANAVRAYAQENLQLSVAKAVARHAVA